MNEICEYIVENFRIKRDRNESNSEGLNGMFGVRSVDGGKWQQEELKGLEKKWEKGVKIGRIFCFGGKEEESGIGEICDEKLEGWGMDVSGKELVSKGINDQNKVFGRRYGIEKKEFENYQRELGKRVKNKEVDVVIVVGMLVRGFDGGSVNSVLVDKNLGFDGVIEGFCGMKRIQE